jgi:hypothetical protein
MYDLIKVSRSYVSKKDEQEHTCYNFYLVDKSGGRIAVKPSFANDYRLMCYLARDDDK